jgi:hypothetical protein
VVVWATVTFGLLPPVRPVLSPVITGSAVLASVPAKVQTTGVPGSGPPVQTTLPVPMRGDRLERGLDGGRVRVIGDVGGGRAVEGEGERAAGGVPVIVTVCTSLMPVIAVSVEPSHCWTGSTPFVQ